MAFKRKICVDFDGVIHWYRDGWKGDEIYDEPVPGAFPWLVAMANDPEFGVYIYSSRSQTDDGIAAMRRWFLAHGLDQAVLDSFEFPAQKPAAWLTIDDRAVCFTGAFPTLQEMADFVPWMKR